MEGVHKYVRTNNKKNEELNNMEISKQKFYIIRKYNLYLLDTEHYYKFASKGKPHLFARISDAKRTLENLNIDSLKKTVIEEIEISFEKEGK